MTFDRVITALAVSWAACGWLAVTIGTPRQMKVADPIGYNLIRFVSGAAAGAALLILWALNVDGMRDAEWRTP